MTGSSLQDVVCVVGHPAVGDPTQFMFERAFAAAGLDWRCLTCDVHPDQLGNALRGLSAMGFRGARIAPPHGQRAVLELARHSTTAERCGAASFVTYDGEQPVADNGVGAAFGAPLRAATDLSAKRAVVLGAGAAAAAIAAELVLAGVATLTIVNRTVARAEQLVERLRRLGTTELLTAPWSGDYVIPVETEIVVHATSLNHLDVDARLAVKWPAVAQLVVVDVSYNPVEPRWMREVKERGFVRLGGVSTFVDQTAQLFQRWTSVTPDVGLLRDALEEFFG